MDNNRKTMKTIEIVRNPYRRNTLMKAKVLTKFQVYIISCSHFTAINIAMKFGKIVSNILI